ncbi:MAG: hypothetical protein ABEJ02_04635, partial [Candidatus Paceibacteria bacterium]
MNKVFRSKNITAFFCVFLFLFATSIFAAPQSAQAKSTPSFLSFEGQLTDSNGNRINNKHDLTIRIYDSKTGGNKLFEETHTNVNPDNGYFSVVIGSNKKLDLDFEQRYWISLEVDNDGEMSPRRPINTVGYSFASDITYGTYATSSQPT